MQIRTDENLSKSDIRGLVRRYSATLLGEADRPFAYETADINEEYEEQRFYAQERISNLSRQIDYKLFDKAQEAFARSYLTANGYDPDFISEDRWKECVEGLARAQREQMRLFLHRLDDSLTEYVPTDPIFHDGHKSTSEPVGLTINELIEAHLRDRKLALTPKTLKTHRSKLLLLMKFLGGETVAETVTSNDLRPYPENLLRLRKEHNRSASKTFHANLTNSEIGRIDPKTAQTIWAQGKAFFRWAHKKGYISTNPAADLSVTIPKKKKGKVSRRSFTSDELTKLFSSTVFTGCKNRFRRFEPGEAIIKDDHFFVPILGYYTGMRLGEIVQLHFEDCVVDGPTPHISINENSDDAHGEDGYKHVKSKAGVRLVPLHPDLMEIGFGDFVKSQKKGAGSRKRVFHRIKFGADGQPSTVYSKWFGRMLDKVGLNDPALVFHSFRHTAQDYLRSNFIPKYVIDQIIGHDDPSSGGGYGDGVGLAETHAAVSGLKLPVSIPSLLKGEQQ